MKNHRLNLLAAGAITALMLGMPALTATAARADALTIQSAQPAALPSDLQQLLDSLPAQTAAGLRKLPIAEQSEALRVFQLIGSLNQTLSNRQELLKSLSPNAQAIVKKLSPSEFAKALPLIRQSVQQSLTPDALEELATLPDSKQKMLLTTIVSQAATVQADKKYNFCNVMLDTEAAIAYDENGVKKLATTAHQCPVAGPKVDLQTTLKYVNKELACAIGDPAYTRVVAPEEYADLRKQMQGTKAAFKGGGIGMNLSQDPTKKLPPSAKQLTEFAAFIKERQNALAHPAADPCSGKPHQYTADELASLSKKIDQPYEPAFTGLVYHVVKNSPSDKAGFKDGDIVTKINDELVTGQDSDVVIDKMRGAIGTPVKVTVMRGSTEITKTLTREAVLPDNVWSRDLGDGIYAIVVTSFERNNTAFMIYDEIQKIGDKARGYIFDVRGNPGGSLDEAIEAVSWFIHDGVILSQRERIAGDAHNPHYLKITWSRVGSHVIKETVDETTGKVTESGIMTMSETDDKTGETLRSFTEMPFLGGKPTVVLANGSSASAAEIFTGGMSENSIAGDNAQGATFIGTHTYGKFIGQTVMAGPAKTAIKATTFRYFSPRGEWLGDAWKVKIGLTPTYKVEQPETAVPYTATDTQLTYSKDYLIKVLQGPAAKTQTP